MENEKVSGIIAIKYDNYIEAIYSKRIADFIYYNQNQVYIYNYSLTLYTKYATFKQIEDLINEHLTDKNYVTFTSTGNFNKFILDNNLDFVWFFDVEKTTWYVQIKSYNKRLQCDELSDPICLDALYYT